MFLAAILVVDDDRLFRRNLVRLCRQSRRTERLRIGEIFEADSFELACAAIEEYRPDIVFLDFMLPRNTGGKIEDQGFELLRRAREANPLTEAIMMSAVRDDASSAVEALTEQGAFYFFVKERFDTRQVQRVLYQAVEKQRLTRDNEQVRRRPGHFVVGAEDASPLDGLVGSSAQNRRLHGLVRRVARSDIHVLITGETGTGKESLARAVHYHSGRREHPFVAVNCSAVPETLWESQFFGHARGAFTGADRDQTGLFEEAGEGTLFLDEVGDIHGSCQAKLLRVLENKEYRALGSSRARQMKARIVAATKRPLSDLVASGDFRDDLYYRLEGFQIKVPPLTRRGQDVLEIAETLLRRHAESMGKKNIRLCREVHPRLLSYDWPGNVRELSNVMERCVLMLDNDARITLQVLSEQGPFHEHDPQQLTSNLSLKEIVAQLRRESDERAQHELEASARKILEQTLKSTGGQVSKASRRLGVARGTLYTYLRIFGVKQRVHG